MNLDVNESQITNYKPLHCKSLLQMEYLGRVTLILHGLPTK